MLAHPTGRHTHAARQLLSSAAAVSNSRAPFCHKLSSQGLLPTYHVRRNNHAAAAEKRQDDTVLTPQSDHDAQEPPKPERNATNEEAGERGAMSRRLEEMTEESIDSNPRRASKVVDEAGFSEDLKRRLEERIAAGSVQAEHQQATSFVNMPASAGKGTRDIAGAEPWSGIEKMNDTALRMLEDAHKPLRGSSAAPRRQHTIKLPSLDMRMKQAAQRGSAAERLANARDKTSIYALSQDSSMSEKEREEVRKMLKERFQPGARPMPTSIQGLQSLASERIEDAIARGLFKNIPRGKGVNVERDYTASSPFLDTTEYFMNKIIQKQEVLPPWVEKQQEVSRTVASFRSRLRNDWKRHAARVIASRGGSLAQQIRKAEQYALAEERVNPKPSKQEVVTSIDPSGQLQRVTVTETIAVAQASTQPTVTVTAEEMRPDAPQDPHVLTSVTAEVLTQHSEEPQSTVAPPEADQPAPASLESLLPFRDPHWEKTELSYHTLALKQLNSLTRSYNLMAPELAKKPYFSLDRELRSCFADVAPQIAGEILQRARAPPEKQLGGFSEGDATDRVLARFGVGERVKVWESRRPQYGFKEFWRDLWSNKAGT